MELRHWEDLSPLFLSLRGLRVFAFALPYAWGDTGDGTWTFQTWTRSGQTQD